MRYLTAKRLSKVRALAPELTFNCDSKIVIMSDCHRGTGNWADNFLNNQHLFFAALTHYDQNDFTYIELGDGDELWENRWLDQIISIHNNAFWLMSRFYQKGKLHLLYGNHDMVKKYDKYTNVHCRTYYNSSVKQSVDLLPNVKYHEGLLLKSKEFDKTIFLVHGHQGDLINDTLWKVSRFLVRYVWTHLELAGLRDPTSAAKNYVKKGKIEKNISDWAMTNNQMTICGHTHKPVMPEPGKGLYFNDGSCVHPRCITAFEIENGAISLVKWSVCTHSDLSLYVCRERLEEPVPLSSYLKD